MIKSLTTAAAKGLWKTGSNTWGATSKWLTKTGWREFKGQEMHHWIIPQNGWGKGVPDVIKNQPFNLMPMPNRAFHEALHGWGEMGPAVRIWEGTPAWAKISTANGIGKSGNALSGGGGNDCN